MIGLGRAYTPMFSNVAVSAKQDFFYIKPAADKVCVIEAAYLSNVGIATDAGDAQEELWDIRLIRLPATVTVGSGGTALEASKIGRMAINDTEASFTGRTNDTTVATTSGTATTLHADGVNIRVPYVWMPPPEHRIVVANAQAVVLRLESTPTDAVTMNGTMIVREIP